MITPQSMSEIMLALEARGLIVRHTDPTHHRIRRAELTPDGSACSPNATSRSTNSRP